MPTNATTAADPRGEVFISPEAFADMEQWHADVAVLRRESPVVRVEVEGWTPFWAITRHADVFEVSRRSDIFWNTEQSAPSPDITYAMLEAVGLALPKTLVHIHGDDPPEVPPGHQRLVQARGGPEPAARHRRHRRRVRRPAR